MIEKGILYFCTDKSRIKLSEIIKDKVVWVTGASSGIGKEIAIQAARAGAIVVLSARSIEKLAIVRASLPGEKHLCLPLDLENSSNFKDLAQEVVSIFGRIDFLFNNGGISQRSEAFDTSEDVERKIMEINYFGNIALAKAILPYMRSQKSGHIIPVSSIAGKFGFYLRSSYSASKHALFGFYESLALEEEKNGIKITIAVPGKINTPISVNALNGEGRLHGVMDHNQTSGMSAHDCVKRLFKAIKSDKLEVLIGNSEIKAVTLKRFLPKLFWRIIKKQPAT